MGKIMKRTMAILLALGLIIVVVPNWGKAKDVEAAGTAIDIVRIANGEVGYVAGAGKNNKYGAYFNTNGVDWCAFFVSWCARMAGVSENVIKTNGWAGDLGSFGAHSYLRGQVNPQPGDIVYYNFNGVAGPEHVEIVTEVRTNTIVSVGGNTGGGNGKVGVREISKTSGYIFGYERPNYNTDNEAPCITNIKVTMDINRYIVECDVTDDVGVDRVRFPSWPSYRSSDGCTWYEPSTINGNHYTFVLRTEDFNYYSGRYLTHIYAYDTAGNQSGVDAKVPIFPQNSFKCCETTFNNHRYELYTCNCSWRDAKVFADALGGHLVTINSVEENEIIKQFFNRGTYEAYWMGATDELSEGTFKWVTDEPFYNFEPGRFDNGGGVEHYLGIWNGNWNDFSNDYCNVGNIGYIVEYEPEVTEVNGFLNGHEYVIIKDALTATEARTKQENGYHLATITSEAEYNFIMNLTKKINPKPAGYWLGANDLEYESHFQWETGEPFVYAPWPEGQPDNDGGSFGDENYFGLWSSGIWNDFYESYKLGYILEKDPFTSTASGAYNEHDYYVSAEYLTREEAEVLQKDGWYLATITSSTERNYIVSLINSLSEKNLRGYWLGASDIGNEGTYKWDNGELFTFCEWDDGQPTNGNTLGQDENYLAILNNGKFNDANESYCHGYILERDPDSRITKVDTINIISDRDETKDAYESDTFQLLATVLPEDATDKTITWTSSDTGYATVDSIGKVTVKDTIPNVIKNITINASSSDGEVTSSYTFTVCPRSSCSHTWNTGTTIKESTCSEVGEKEYSCTKCGTTKIEPVEQKAHTIVIDDAVPEKCELDGKTEGSHCSVCGKVIVEQKIIPASGHNYGDYISDNNETCTTDATATAKCTKCGRENSIIVEGTATGVHIWTEYEVIKPATCTDIGVKQRECVYCGKKETLGIAKLSHEYEEEVQQKATCTEEGIKRLKCKNCGNEKYESIDMIDHVLVDIPAIPSNCTKAGMTAGKKCSECGKVVVAPKATALAAHKVVIDPAVEATTTSTGLTSGSHCSECGVIIEEQKVIPKKVETNGSEQSVSDGKASEGSGTSGSNSSNNSNASNSNNNETSGTTPQKPTNKLEKTSDGTKYYKEDGSAAKSEWVLIDGKKYYFNDDGYAASNEWRDGKWINNDGSCTYTGTLSWKGNSTGWWVEDTAGWYPQDLWQKIDGVWYYFKPDGYMASGEYYNGYWFNKDGSWDDKYLLSWRSNSTGWWVEDISGWWPSNSWLKIDGEWYYFDASGYMVTNQYVDGYWIGSDGVCR